MGRVVLRKETARRGGKTVIVVDNFASLERRHIDNAGDIPLHQDVIGVSTNIMMAELILDVG